MEITYSSQTLFHVGRLSLNFPVLEVAAFLLGMLLALSVV